MIRTTVRRSSVASAVLAAFAAVACGTDSGPRTPLAMAAQADSAKRVEAAHSLIGPAAKAALDSGNALFRKKLYAPALVEYRAAADLAPQHAAPIFGVYMSARAMNDNRLADSALKEISKRNGPLPTASHEFSDSALKALHQKLGKRSTSGG